jgi:hypothetical protein
VKAMGSAKARILGIVLFIICPIAVFSLYKMGLVQNITAVVDDIVAGAVVAVLTAAVALLLWGNMGKDKVPAGEKITFSQSTHQKTRWTSRLRKPIKEDKRMGMFVNSILMLILAPVSFAIAFSIPTKTIPSQNMLMFNAIRVSSIGAGISIELLGAFIGLNLLLDVVESRKQQDQKRETTYNTMVKDFDNAFDAIQQVSEPSTKLKMLFDFQIQLNKFCQNYEWNQVKGRIDKVLESLIPNKLNDDPFGRRYIQILAVILHRYDENVLSTIKKKWEVELEKLFNDPVYRTDDIATIFVMLQQLHGYGEEFLGKIIDNATTQWTKLKFSLLAHYIEFAKLKESDEAAYIRVLAYIRRKMEQAAQTNEEEERERLELIYDLAKK